jgi:hypothetical protein|nr:hypothetical protein [Kofleriaceae bacterium]
MTQPRGKTRRYDAPSIADVDASAVYVFSSHGTEPRSRSALWAECIAQRPDQVVEIVSSDSASVTVSISGTTSTIQLLDAGGLTGLFRGWSTAYLDISGLAHTVWAPLVRTGLTSLTKFYATYVEPEEYKRHPSPTSVSQFDLSDGFGGVAPLPTFARLPGPVDESNSIFVALLGFEGTRARFVANSLDPVPTAYALVGLPGFRPEYPQYALMSNEEFLAENKAHANVRYAAAGCPFECMDVLADIHREHPGAYMYLAPVGTKPHALGAILYSLDNPQNTELMYDHPQRKQDRTRGVGQMHIYSLKA